MMKKNGFTLAEVLITLAIIGVVATLTLPALMTNTQEQQSRTALKKGINTLTEAAQMNQAIDGFDYATFSTTSTNNANDVPDEVGNKENPNDASNDTTADINKQEEQRQEEILNSRIFKKFEEENAA